MYSKRTFTIVILFLLLSLWCFAQNGINYKAIVKDASGNILASSPVTIQFVVYEGVALTNNVYEESHTTNTDSNGLVIVNIGEGTTADTFTNIAWEHDEHYLNVQLNTGAGLIDLGTTTFKAVPYALHATTAANVTGLETLNEGNGEGLRIIGRDPANYVDIGGNAVDLSFSDNPSSTRGASGVYSNAMGFRTTASNNFSTAMGFETIASGNTSTAIGITTFASGQGSTAMGVSTTASGDYSTAMGASTTAPSFGETAIGRYNTTYTPNSVTSWNPNDRLVVIGNGEFNDNSDALIILKNGTITAPSFDLAEITDDKALVTKEYVDTNLGSTGLEAIDEGNGIGWRLKGSNPDYYGNIGGSAIDFSRRGFNSPPEGATGLWSVAIGLDATASGSSSTAMGIFTRASGSSSTAMGRSTNALSFAETVIGSYNTFYNPNSATTWDANDRLFVVGNGTGNGSNRSDALTILKNGATTINSSTTGLRINSGTGDGISILSPGLDGIYIQSAVNDGIEVNGCGSNGIAALSAGHNGGAFQGVTSGVHATSSNNANPDIILGGNSSSATGDDGIIASDPAYAGSDIWLRSNDAVIVQLDFDNNESGNFEIKNSTNTEVFDVSEAGNVVIAGSLTQNSDRRLKKDITDLSYGLKEILKLQPKTYNWKNRKEQHKSIGLIAQDVQPLIKEIVTAQDDEAKTLGISYTELIPVLINAIREQQTQIEAQNLKISNMSAELQNTKDLEQRIKQIEHILKTTNVKL